MSNRGDDVWEETKLVVAVKQAQPGFLLPAASLFCVTKQQELGAQDTEKHSVRKHGRSKLGAGLVCKLVQSYCDKLLALQLSPYWQGDSNMLNVSLLVVCSARVHAVFH